MCGSFFDVIFGANMGVVGRTINVGEGILRYPIGRNSGRTGGEVRSGIDRYRHAYWKVARALKSSLKNMHQALRRTYMRNVTIDNVTDIVIKSLGDSGEITPAIAKS